MPSERKKRIGGNSLFPKGKLVIRKTYCDRCKQETDFKITDAGLALISEYHCTTCGYQAVDTPGIFEPNPTIKFKHKS